MKLAEFKKLVDVSREQICREIYSENRDRIKVKKESLAVKNLARIFDATLDISGRKGFHAMSLRDLSAETGLSLGALYAYFSSKDELLESIQVQGIRIAGKVLTDMLVGVDGPRERLHMAVRSHLYLSEVLQPWFYFSYMEAKNLDRAQQRRAIESELMTEKVFIDILEQGRREGAFRLEEANLTAAVIKAMLQDWYLKRWKYVSRRITVEAYADFILSFIDAFINVDVTPAGKNRAR